MNFVTKNGRTKKVFAHKYYIDWQKPSRSKLQKKVKDLLYLIWRGHAVYEEFPIAGTRSTLDFYNSTLSVAIEVQGKQHTKHIAHFHGRKMIKFMDQLKRDRDKEHFCELNGIKLVEIMEGDDITLDYLRKKLS